MTKKSSVLVSVIFAIVIIILIFIKSYIMESEEQVVLTNENNEYTYSGELNNPIIIDSGKDVKLIFNNVSINSLNGPAIKVKGNAEIILLANSQNNLSDIVSENYDGNGVIDVSGNLKISGQGKLNIISTNKHAIYSDENISVSESTVNILKSAKDGIHSIDDTELLNCNLVMSDISDDGIKSDSKVSITDGIIKLETVGKGISAEKSVTINSGKITIDSENEGIESNNVLTINNGNINIKSVDDGINAGSDIIINNGNINITASSNDAIDSNGSLIINDGKVYAFGARMPEGGIDCDNREVIINGGIVFCIGGVNSIASGNSKQKSLSLLVNDSNVFKMLDYTIAIPKIMDSSPKLNNKYPEQNINTNQKPEELVFDDFNKNFNNSLYVLISVPEFNNLETVDIKIGAEQAVKYQLNNIVNGESNLIGGEKFGRRDISEGREEISSNRITVPAFNG